MVQEAKFAVLFCQAAAKPANTAAMAISLIAITPVPNHQATEVRAALAAPNAMVNAFQAPISLIIIGI